MLICENLLLARKRKKLSQRELGKLVGVSGTIIGAYEKGTRSPRAKTLQQLAQALDVSMNWLVSKEGLNQRVQYKVQFDNLVNLIDLMLCPEEQRKALKSYANLTWTLTELNNALQADMSMTTDEMSADNELDALRKIEVLAHTCCKYFEELQSAYPTGCNGLRETILTWGKEQQKFNDLLIEYSKMNPMGRKIVVHTATALAVLPEYQKTSEKGLHR